MIAYGRLLAPTFGAWFPTKMKVPHALRPALAALALGLATAHGHADAQAGLAVDQTGTLTRAGSVYRGIGVNYYDAFVRTLATPSRTNFDAGFKVLADRRIPFARFAACGYWPIEWGLYRTNRAEHFARLDAVVRSAERHHIGLIPSLFWYLSTVPDVVGEPCRSWGDPGSRTHALMREYTREVVTRYKDSPAIWAWEFGNEYNLPADLPNAAQHRPAVVPQLGTPATRSADDDLTHAAFRTALIEFAREVRRHDPTRPILSGNAFPRRSAWHQAREKSWKHDTEAQFAEVLGADNPAPIDTLSVRAYDLQDDVARLAQAMAVSRTLRKPLFVGEFGVPAGGKSDPHATFNRILEAIESAGVPLAALWVYDFDGQAKDWNVTATNDRAWQLDAIQQANVRIKQ